MRSIRLGAVRPDDFRVGGRVHASGVAARLVVFRPKPTAE
jgi:hypothetical protein